MSGGHDEAPSTAEIVNNVMARFNVNKETAEEIINYCITSSIERMEKWRRNWKKIQKGKADELYRLTRRLKKGDKSVIDEIEKRVLEMCVEG